MNRTLVLSMVAFFTATPALAGKKTDAGNSKSDASIEASGKDDFLDGQTVYFRSGAVFTADAYSVTPSLMTSVQYPYRLAMTSSGGGDVQLDDAYLEDLGDVSELVERDGGDLSVKSDSDLSGLGLAVSFDGGDGSDFESLVTVEGEDGTETSLGVAISGEKLTLWVEGAAAKEKSCDLVFWEDGAVVYEEEVACSDKVAVIVRNPKPVYADIHIFPGNGHPVITTNGQASYIFD